MPTFEERRAEIEPTDSVQYIDCVGLKVGIAYDAIWLEYGGKTTFRLRPRVAKQVRDALLELFPLEPKDVQSE